MKKKKVRKYATRRKGGEKKNGGVASLYNSPRWDDSSDPDEELCGQLYCSFVRSRAPFDALFHLKITEIKFHKRVAKRSQQGSSSRLEESGSCNRVKSSKKRKEKKRKKKSKSLSLSLYIYIYIYFIQTLAETLA